MREEKNSQKQFFKHKMLFEFDKNDLIATYWMDGVEQRIINLRGMQ